MPTTSEKIIMTCNKLGEDFRKKEREAREAKRPEGAEKRPPMPPMGGPGMPPMGGPGMPPMGPPPHVRVMMLLREMGKPVKKHAIGMILGFHPKMTNDIINKLAEEGAVDVQVSEENPKKATVEITEAGIAKMEAKKAEKAQFADDYFSELTEEEKETLLALLKKVIKK